MSLFSKNKNNYNLPYRNRKEFLSRFIVYSDFQLLKKLEMFVPLGDEETEKKELLLQWLSARIPEDISEAEEIKQELYARAEMSNAAGYDLGIPTMLYNLDLQQEDSTESQLITFFLGDENQKIRDIASRVLFLSSCMRADPRYSELAGLLSGRSEVLEKLTLGELIDICREEKVAALESELAVCCSILNVFFLGTVLTDNPLSTPAWCDDRLMGAIWGNDGFLPGWMDRTSPDTEIGEIKFRDDIIERLVKGLEVPGRITALCGDQGAGKKTLVFAAAGEIGRPVVICQVGDRLRSDSDSSNPAEKDYYADYDEIDKRLLYARRECVFTGSVLLVEGLGTGCETVAGNMAGFINSQLRRYVWAVFIAYDSDKEPTLPPYVIPEVIPALSNQQRIELWKDFLNPGLVVDNGIVEETGATFEFTPGQIKEAADRIASYGETHPDKKLFHKASYGVLKGRLSTKATLVESGFNWDDIKLYPREKNIMRDICTAVENRPMVMQDWNFKSKLPYGSGITVLFAGPPGTGKTMSATVIANELGMELYKIDSSRLIDKYVGETEKNIREIFNLASRSNAILFFDEADAIFNKRMDAKDANERFANIESSLLLQCIEEYNGVVILATNKMSAMDPAFMRRFRFYIQFPEPDENLAYSIWTSVFPKEAPLAEDIDFRELARVFKITGAVIKNISLQAAFLAAGKGEAIDMVHILRAARREMEKNHKVITREELGKLSYLYQDMMKD